MIGIIGAMDLEVSGLRELMTDVSEKKFASFTFIKGRLLGSECVSTVSGIGKVNSAACTQALIMLYQPQIIINTGVAGSLSPEIHIGDIVISDFVVQHDIDTSAVGGELGLIPGLNLVYIPCSKVLLSKCHGIIHSSPQNKIHIGTIASGDQFIADKNRLLRIRDNFGAVACDMESGSICQISYLNGIDFLAIRSLSDNANYESTIDYEVFKHICAKNSVNFVLDLLQTI